MYINAHLFKHKSCLGANFFNWSLFAGYNIEWYADMSSLFYIAHKN